MVSTIIILHRGVSPPIGAYGERGKDEKKRAARNRAALEMIHICVTQST